MRYIEGPGARFSKVPKLFGCISGNIILFLSSKRRCLEAHDFAVIVIFIPFLTSMNILFPTDKRRGVQESCGKDDGAAESLGASPPNSRFVYGPDFAAGIHPRYSMYGTERHVLSDGNSAVMDTQRSHDHKLSLTINSTQFGCGEQVEESLAASCMVVGSRDFPLPSTVSTFTASCTMGVSNSTNQSSIAVASNFTSTGTSTYANSVCSSTLSGGGNEETSLSPACSEVNSASERRTAKEESRVFGSWEEMMKGVKRIQQIIKECRESEEEGEGEKDEKVERWRCEHYQRRCRVRFSCCSQFYPCHRCHNRSTNCKNDEAKECHATHLKCSLCEFEQEVSFYLLSLRVHVTVGSLRNDHGNGGDSASVESYDWLNQEK